MSPSHHCGFWTQCVNVLALTFLVARVASAGLIGDYAPENFSLSNSNADGTAVFSGSGSLLTLTGGNNGSGFPGATDVFVTVAQVGSLGFSYSYSTLDSELDTDWAGTLLNGVFTPFPAPSGTLSVNVLGGDQFGFRVATSDNQGEPGVLEISDFSAQGSQSVPEPNTFWMLTIAGGLALLFRSRGIAALITLGLAIPGQSVLAQQVSYSGNTITGQLTRTAVVDPNIVASAARTSAYGAKGSAQKTVPLLSGPDVESSRGSRLRSRLAMPSAQSLPVTSVTSAKGFTGLTHLDQRMASNGNQFSIEPPNQSVAVGNGFILEGVNNAVMVYDTSGAPKLVKVIASNQLFGLLPAVNRATGANGVFPTDMRVFFDHSISRWFVIQRAQDNDIFGNNLNSSHLYIAVSQSDDPTRAYNIYTIDTTNSNHRGCPCLSDFPQIGSDQYGFYISSNQYDTYYTQFVDVSLLVISKAQLASGAITPAVQQFFIGGKGFAFTIHPATTPPGASYFLASGGVEYFISTRAGSAADDAYSIWAMYNTASIDNPAPNPTLLQITLSGPPYLLPDVATQKTGPLPYGSTLIPPGLLAKLDSGDSRVLSAVYSGGRLFATLATQLKDEDGKAVVGAVYVIFSPTFRSGKLAATVLRQGYLMARGQHLLRPAISVNASGKGAIGLTLAGPDHFPSAAFVPIDVSSTGPAIQIAAAGAAPEDGFTGYATPGLPGLARWGDYNTAVTSPDGTIWIVAQYIPNAPRTDFANWGTFVFSYKP